MNLTEWLTLTNVFLTAVFAGLTFFILRANRATVTAMREQMADQNRPFITVTVQIRVGTPVIQLLVKNVGRSPAQNVTLRLDRDFFQFGEQDEGRNLAKQSAFSKSIDCLPPMSELLFDLNSDIERIKSDAYQKMRPHTFTVTVENLQAKTQYSEQHHVDHSPYKSTSVPQHPIVEELDKVKKSIDKLTSTVKQSANAVINARPAGDKHD